MIGCSFSMLTLIDGYGIKTQLLQVLHKKLNKFIKQVNLTAEMSKEDQK